MLDRPTQSHCEETSGIEGRSLDIVPRPNSIGRCCMLLHLRQGQQPHSVPGESLESDSRGAKTQSICDQNEGSCPPSAPVPTARQPQARDLQSVHHEGEDLRLVPLASSVYNLDEKLLDKQAQDVPSFRSGLYV